MNKRALFSWRRSTGAAFLLVLAVVLTACGPTHTEPRWASLRAVNETGQVILAFGDRLTLVNAVDGKPASLLDADGEVRVDENGNARLWEVVSPDSQQTRFYNAPIFLDEDTMLANSYDRRLLEVDVPAARADGQIVNVDDVQHMVSGLVSDGERVYVGLSEHDLLAYNLGTLDLAWRVTTEYGVWAEPVIVDGTVYFSSLDHFLYAVDAETGELRWKTDLQGAITGSPVYQDGHLYVGSFARKVFDVSAETGEILAEAPTSDWVWSAPAISEDRLYAADVSGSVYAFDISDGLTQDWAQRVSQRSITPSPLVAGEYIVVGSRDQNVYWLNQSDGAVVDTRQVAGEVLANLVLLEPAETNELTEPLVIVSTSAMNELLVAFTLESGQRQWVYGR